MSRRCYINVVRHLILVLLLVASARSKDCTLKTLCSCEFDDGSGTVDLTSLAHSDNTPVFKDVPCSNDGYFYSYSPCGGFNEDECQDAAVCVLDQDKSESQQIGDDGRAAFKYDSDNVLAAYTSGTGVLKLTTVTLVCDQTACDPVVTAQGQTSPGSFELTLTSVCACPGGCTSSGPSHCSSKGGSGGAISGGSIFLILLFTVIVIYFVAGMLLSKFVSKKEGKEIVPNFLFWRSLPVLIKTGVMFTFGICIPKCKRTTYDKI